MWLRHFAHKRKRPRFRAFREAYLMFRPADVVPICNWHHEEIHEIYYAIIGQWVSDNGMIPMSDWTWAMADRLMRHLREICDNWLSISTPGTEPVRYAVKHTIIVSKFHNETSREKA